MKFIFILFVTLILLSCSTSISYYPIKTGISPKKVDSNIDVYEIGFTIPKKYKAIGKVEIGDTGFTLKCGLELVYKQLKNEARKAGGDAVIITNFDRPDLLSSCYRVDATVIVYE